LPTAIVAKEMHVDQAVEGFTDILEELRLTPGAVIVEEQIRRINKSKEQAKENLGNIIVP